MPSTKRAPRKPKPIRQEWEIQWGERVKEEREDRGWSRQDLADKLGVDLTTVFRIEKGELNPNESLKWRIAGVYRLRMDRLWTYPAIVPDFEAAS